MTPTTTLSETADRVSALRRRKKAEERHAKRAVEAAKLAVIKLKGDGVMRLPEVLAVVGVSKSTWWAGVGSKYPSPIRVGGARTASWKAEDIRQLIQHGVARGTV